MNKKWLVLACAVMASTVVAVAQTFVGHRGSIWGVENTAEAFINGAKAGYGYLECDVSVAADGTFVICHDDTTNRIGGSLTVADATLEQLRAETYTQTRNGVTYTGSICTLEEYLDICRKYQVVPVIELKSATGINKDDCSNIGRLIETVEAAGFRNNCVIISFIWECIDNISKNYPDIKLQFLDGDGWEKNFYWCVDNNIDVDLYHGSVTQATVENCHKAGLKVNVWTVNDPQRCQQLIEMGCDFITTDCLLPSDYKK